MEDELLTVIDLQKMILRAWFELSFFIFPYHLHDEWRFGVRQFIKDCEQFQLDLLRPWDRTD